MHFTSRAKANQWDYWKVENSRRAIVRLRMHLGTIYIFIKKGKIKFKIKKPFEHFR